MIDVPSDESLVNTQGQPPKKSAAPRIIVFLLFLVALAFGLWAFGDQLSLSKLAARESAFRQYQVHHPILVYLVAFLIYVTVTGMSLPGATAMTLLIGWLFGFWRGLVLVSFGSTTGATVAFLLSRYLLQQSITRRFGSRLEPFNDALRREGAFYLFSLRLIPAVPFFVINAVMGLTPIRARTFFWVSQIGMLPGTAVYVYAGASVPNLQTLADKGINAIFTPSQMTQILGAFVMLGVFPLVVRAIMKRLTRNRISGVQAADVPHSTTP
ncbi:MAG: TVP38/TMEM64 family protein [Planctomycetaceae bacterium]